MSAVWRACTVLKRSGEGNSCGNISCQGASCCRAFMPKHKTGVKVSLGTIGYYRSFITDYSSEVKPLFQLSSSEHKQQGVRKNSWALTQVPILTYRGYSKPFALDTVPSQVAMGAKLSQKHHSVKRFVADYYGTCSPEQSNYCVTWKELLSVIKALESFTPCLYGNLRCKLTMLDWPGCLKHPLQVGNWQGGRKLWPGLIYSWSLGEAHQ